VSKGRPFSFKIVSRFQGNDPGGKTTHGLVSRQVVLPGPIQNNIHVLCLSLVQHVKSLTHRPRASIKRPGNQNHGIGPGHEHGGIITGQYGGAVDNDKIMIAAELSEEFTQFGAEEKALRFGIASACRDKGETFTAGGVYYGTGAGIAAQIIQDAGLTSFAHQTLQAAALFVGID
jgi:hypothetical protein